MCGNSFRSNGVNIDAHLATRGLIAGFYIDTTPATGINPTSGNNVQDGVHSRLAGTLCNGVVTGSTIDGLAYHFDVLTDTAADKFWCIGLQTDVPYAKRGGVSTAGPGEARCTRYTNCDMAPVWTYSDYPGPQFQAATSMVRLSSIPVSIEDLA